MSDTGHNCIDVKWYGDCPMCRIDTLLTERDQLLNMLEETLGAIMKITKRGQAYDVAKRALASLKGGTEE